MPAAEVETRPWAEQLAIDEESYRDQLDYLFTRSAFYQAKLSRAGVDSAGAAGGLAEIARLPLTDKQEPATLSGITGETFYGQMTNDRGVVLQVKMTIIPMAVEVAATQTILTTPNMSAAQRGALDQALRTISLTGKR